MRTRTARCIAIAIAIAIVPVVGTGAVEATGTPLMLTVDTTADLGSSASCSVAGSGKCSLRKAIAAANASSGATITIPAGTYVLNGGSGSDTGDLDLKKSVTLVGADQAAAAAGTKIVGSNDRVLDISGSGVAVSVRGLRISGGNTPSDVGGGIRVASGATLVLLSSSVSASTAKEGAGIHNSGTVTIDRSTISNNTTSGKGGGLFNTGTATIRNSTIFGNTAKGGGGIASSGTVTLTHSNVTSNTSNNSNGGGIYRVGGSFKVRSAVLADNNGVSGRDCYGSPTFLGVNLVEGTTGCQPVGTVIALDPQLGALADNGGPTLTQLPAASSPAIDATPCDGAITVDQRNISRPSGAACDLGAVELAPLIFDVTLGVSPAHVNVGVQSIPTSAIPPSVLGTAYSSTDDTTTEDSALARIALARIALARIDIEGTALARIALARIMIEDLALARIAVSDTALARILISEIEPQDGWQPVLVGSALANLPLQTVTLAEVMTDPVAGPRLQALDLSKLDVNATLLGELPLVLFAFAGQTFDTLPPDTTSPLAALEQWATLLDVPAADLAGRTPLSTALARIDVSDAALARIALARIDLLASALARIALARIDVDSSTASPEVAALARIALARIDVANTALARIALARITIDSTALARIALARIALARIDIANTALARIALARIAPAHINSIVDCSTVNCSTGTLLTALNAQAIRPSATIANLILGLQGSADGTQIQDLLAAASGPIDSDAIEVGDLLRLLAGSPLDGLTLADFFPALVSDADLPWQDIDLEATALQNLNSPPAAPATFTSTITVGNATPNVSLSLSLPAGFAAVADSARLDLNGAAAPAAVAVAIPTNITGENTLVFQLGTVPPGTHTFSVQARAGIRVGTFDAVLVGLAVNGSTTRTDEAAASIAVDENADTSFGPLSTDTLYIGHLVSSDDDDVYTTTFEVTPQQAAEGRRGTVYLSNLAVDYDLAVFGPAADPLRAEPIEGFVPVDDRQLGADPASEAVAPDIQFDVPLTAPAGSVLVGLSANRASAPERVDLGDLRAGTYSVQVAGYNGAFSDQPFTLRVRTQSLHLPACSARVLPSAPTGNVTSVVPNDIDTLFVVPVNRLRQLWGTSTTAELMAQLDEFVAARPGGVISGILPVDASYAAWDANRCFPAAANDVARSIAAQIDVVRADNPTLRHLVLVGDDTALPFFRLADGTTTANESSYAQGFDGNNALVGALARGYVQSDDPYATTRGISLNGRELFVPELAAGRLVETKDDIVKALDTFELYGGQLDPATTSSALVTGYDFLSDGATSVADALQADGFPTTSLINDDWTSAQLIDALVTADPDIASVNAHFDHNRALPADQNAAGTEDDLFEVDDLPTDDRLAAGLLFSMGCHGGLSVSDIELGVSGDSADWAQAFAGNGAQWIGNTGFGYGDTELIAYSERLMALFAEELAADGSITTGQALSMAKRVYAATTQVWSPYDEKALQEVVHYGLPMYRVGTAAVAPEPEAAAAPPVIEATDAGLLTTPDPRTGVPSAAIELDMTGVERNDVDGGGSYFSLDGNTLHVKDRPVQPLSVSDVPLPSTEPAQVPHGVLITGLTSHEVGAAGEVEVFHPYTAEPVIDQSQSEVMDGTPGDAIFPATLARVTRSTGVAGEPLSSLLFSAGQFRPTGAGVGTQRLYDHAIVQVLYGSSDDFVPPTIETTRGALIAPDAVGAPQTVGFVVDTDNTAGRVVVLFKGVAEHTWRSIDLVDTDSRTDVAHWTGGAVVPASFEQVEFFIQACDFAGNCSTSNNKASNFEPTAAVDDAQLAVTPSGTRVNGWFTSPSVPVTITSTGGCAIQYSLDGAAWVDYPGSAITVTGDGIHRIEARDLCRNESLAIIPIDTTAPLITATAIPDTAPLWSTSPVTVTITAIDPSGSGIDAITYSVAGGADQTVSGETVQVIVTADGVTTITFSAVDAASNHGASGSITVRIDATAPAMACSRESDTTTWYNANQTVTCLPSDDTSGLLSPEPLVLSTAVAPDTETIAAPTDSRDACDNAGNCTTAGPFTFNVDLRGPVVNCTAPPVPPSGWFRANVDVSCSATDEGSGLVGEAAFTLSTNVGTGGADALAMTSAATVLDHANNASVVGPFGPYAVDLAPPTVTVSVPATDATFTIGAVVSPVFACADLGAGVASCTPSSAQLNTSTPGSRTFSVTAVDRAGNQTTVTSTYTVVYGVCLKYDPSRPNQIFGAIVLRVQLCNAAGANLSSPSIQLLATLIDGTTTPPPNHYSPAYTHLDFKYLLGSYYYHLDASELTGLGAGLHSLGFTVNGVGGYSAPFTLQ